MLLCVRWQECQHLCSRRFWFSFPFPAFTATSSGFSFCCTRALGRGTLVFIISTFLGVFVRKDVCSTAAALQSELRSYIWISPIQNSISWKYFQVFLSAPVVLLWSVIFLWEASSLSHLRLHCSPMTFTSVEILLNSLAILLNMSFLVAFPFPNSSLCFCQQLTRSFTWKSSHRSSIECDRPVKKHTKCLNWSSLLQPQLGIVLKMSKCTSIVIFLGVLLQPHRFFAFSPFCHFYNNINFTGKSVSAHSQDIGNGGKNLAVVQMERHISVPIGCNEKSGAAPKVVRLFWKISSGTPRSICISTGWTGNFG